MIGSGEAVTRHGSGLLRDGAGTAAAIGHYRYTHRRWGRNGRTAVWRPAPARDRYRGRQRVAAATARTLFRLDAIFASTPRYCHSPFDKAAQWSRSGLRQELGLIAADIESGLDVLSRTSSAVARRQLARSTRRCLRGKQQQPSLISAPRHLCFPPGGPTNRKLFDLTAKDRR